jgi:hypothetical protein
VTRRWTPELEDQLRRTVIKGQLDLDGGCAEETTVSPKKVDDSSDAIVES